MKVGILSMQRVPNYGSFLQAYALKQMLLDCGADEIEFIDIEQGEIVFKNTIFLRAWHLVQHLYKGTLAQRYELKAWDKRNAEQFASYNSLLGISNNRNSKGEWDLVVIGSDEVFNCCQMCSWGFSLHLFGQIEGAKKVVSYAASFGYTTLPMLQKHNMADKISHAMQTMSSISVRDDNSSQIVEQLIGKKPMMHLDPVLAFGYQKEIAGLSLPEFSDYVLIYSYNGRIKTEEEIQAIVAFASNHNKRLFSLYCHYDWCDNELIPNSPIEILSFFKGADYVIADTFHGTIFSIITHKRFCTLVRSNNRQKLNSLLVFLHLQEQLVESPEAIDNALSHDINYAVVSSVLQEEHDRTIEYLTQCILKYN